MITHCFSSKRSQVGLLRFLIFYALLAYLVACGHTCTALPTGVPRVVFFVPRTCNSHVPTRQAKLYKWVVKRAMYGGAVIYALLTPIKEDLSHHYYFHFLTKTKAIPSSYAPPWANQPFLYNMRNLIFVGNFLTNIIEEKTERYNV